MGTRQLRISDRDKVATQIKGYLGKPVTIVLTDRTAMFGFLDKVETQHIVLKNMRLQKKKYPLDHIDEIYVDSQSNA